MARVLVVDDDPVILGLLQISLQQAGYEVQTALDGEEALQLLSDRSQPIPDVIITDVRMPKRGGLELLREIEPDPRLRSVQKILMSSDALPAQVGRCHVFLPKERLHLDLINTLTKLEAKLN